MYERRVERVKAGQATGVPGRRRVWQHLRVEKALRRVLRVAAPMSKHTPNTAAAHVT